MPTITTATVDVGVAEYGKNAAERAVLRIVSPMKVGVTLIKSDGVWSCVRTPSQSVLDAAEHYFLGGHVYDISDDLWAEIQASGVSCMPTATSTDGGPLYPSLTLYPSRSLNPRND